MEQSNKIQPRLANSSLRLESGIWNLGSRVSKLDFTLADKKVEKFFSRNKKDPLRSTQAWRKRLRTSLSWASIWETQIIGGSEIV